MLFSKAKTPKIFRALRAQSHPESWDFPNSPRGVSKFFACGAIRLGGFRNFYEIHQFGLGGFSTRGGFYFDLPGSVGISSRSATLLPSAQRSGIIFWTLLPIFCKKKMKKKYWKLLKLWINERFKRCPPIWAKIRRKQVIDLQQFPVVNRWPVSGRFLLRSCLIA